METTTLPSPPTMLPASATEIPAVDQPPAWNTATRIAFRFCVAYFGLYVLTTQMLGSLFPTPVLGIPPLQGVPPIRAIEFWIGRHIFGITRPILDRPTGSGDKAIDWLHIFFMLVVAVIVTGVWSLRARNKQEHSVLFRRFRAFARLALATTMLTYGLSKVFPLQMPIDSLARLVEPFGNFSPMGVLWSSIGASPAYEIFVGLAEVCCAALLFIPLTAPLGALMALMNSIAIFTLNMTYDVPVKQFSFHLILISLFLIAPNIPRYFSFFILRTSTSIRIEPPLGVTPRTRRNFVIAQIVFGVYAILIGVSARARMWNVYGPGAPKAPIYGIWNVESMTIDGQPSPAVVTDTSRLRRAIFQRMTAATFQRMNDQLSQYAAVFDTVQRTLTLTSFDTTRARSTFTYERPSKDRLVLEGTIDGHETHMELSYRDPHSFLQKNRGFHLVSEAPFNR